MTHCVNTTKSTDVANCYQYIPTGTNLRLADFSLSLSSLKIASYLCPHLTAKGNLYNQRHRTHEAIAFVLLCPLNTAGGSLIEKECQCYFKLNGFAYSCRIYSKNFSGTKGASSRRVTNRVFLPVWLIFFVSAVSPLVTGAYNS